MYVYDDVLGDRVEKFGHVLNISDGFLMNLFSVSTAMLETMEALHSK